MLSINEGKVILWNSSNIKMKIGGKFWKKLVNATGKKKNVN